MFKNYFFLNRFIVEANSELAGFSLYSIFTQEKDKLILVFRSGESEIFLEISVNPGFPYLNLRKNYSRAKKNTIDFYTELLPASFISIEIAVSDRVIRLNLSSLEIYFVIRGKYTNVYFKNNLDTQPFKKTEHEIIEIFIKEVGKLEFSPYYNIPEFNQDKMNQEIFRKKFPVIGKEIIAETLTRSSSVDDFDLKVIKEILIEIGTEKPAVFIDDVNSQVRLGINTFSIFDHTSVQVFDDLHSAFNFFLSRYFRTETADVKKRIIKKHLDRELGKLSSKLNKLMNRIETGSREEEYNKLGSLLLINLNSIKKGMEKIDAADIYNNDSTVIIKLDDKLSPQQNADYYFEKSKAEKINYSKSKELFDALNKEYKRLRGIESRFSKSQTPDELEDIMKELKIKNEENMSSKDELKDKFKHYIIFDKYHVFVGKDSANNDLLTTKFAKQNDYWFHARSVPGSHVVLRVENTKEAVPKDVLKKTAALAAYHSKSKTSGMAPVSYAQKKYVVKKKGMEPGKVALLKEEVLIVKPEIPAGVKYVEA